MKYALIVLMLVAGISILSATNWAVSGLVTLDSVDPVLTIISPQVDDIYVIEDQIPVQWSTQESNVPDNCIDISWRPDAGSGWQTIQSGYDDTGSYGWAAPTANTNTATLMIGMTDAFGNLGSAVSDPFAILPPMADFSANTLSGFLPLEVHFTDLSPGSPLAWDWDFNGDGISDSHEQNPVWVYDFPGSYTVSLTVDYGSEQPTESRANYITASLDPATVLNVPTQYPTIQSAIDAADDGDYIIVADGIYYENLQIVGKQITLASHYFIDGDTLHIDDTIIDGSQYRNRDEGSVIAIRPGANPFLSSHIIGFTVTHGRGRSITQSVGGVPVTKVVGGGVFVEQNHPILTRNKIVENDADDEGGGSYALQGLPNLGGIVGIGRVNHGGNQFRDNQADIGKDIYIDGVTFRDEIKAQNCSFSVFAEEDTTVSQYWATSAAPIDYSGGRGERDAITTDIYVATDGSNANSGTSADSPFLSIDHALSLAYGSQESPLTIHLAAGVYSPSFTGERFPLQMLSWVTLAGSGADETFLDAEATVDNPNRVLNLDKVQGSVVRDLTITGGVVTTAKGVNGGGIAVLDADVSLASLAAMNFSAAGDGGCLHITNSTAHCDNLEITSSTASGYGGGMALEASQTYLNGGSVSNNSANRGAGIYANEGWISLDGTEVLDNATTGSLRRGGGIYLVSGAQSRIANSTIKGNSADTGAGINLQDVSNITLLNNRIVNNLQSVASFSNGGGGLYWNSTCSGLVANNLFANNTAYQGGAGFGMSALDFVNNTIVNNRANYRGGGFYLNACSPTYHNTILWGNSAPSGGNQLWLQTNTSDPQITYCDVQGGSAAFGLSTGSYTGVYENNLNSNPLFISPSSGAGTAYDALAADFSIPESSPCVDMGDPDTDVSAMPLDLAGLYRISGTAIDIGAYEFQFPITFLEPPQNVSISISGNTLTLAWNSVMGASTYRVFACDAPSGDGWMEIPFGNGTLSQNGNRLDWSIALNGAAKRFYYVKAGTDRNLPAGRGQ
jgi:PKD repeat protein